MQHVKARAEGLLSLNENGYASIDKFTCTQGSGLVVNKVGTNLRDQGSNLIIDKIQVISSHLPNG